MSTSENSLSHPHRAKEVTLASQSKSWYEVTFREPQESAVTTIKARTVEDSQLGLGFVCFSDFVFETNKVVLNPAEEALQTRYANVKRIHLPIYAVLCVEEVGADHEGLSLEADRSKLIVLHPNGEDT
ncbi:MAG: DUF1820 family protein [Proteobacteria bacterium]|nr:DUF1820 family protein [Pseudomonadota bacterium]